MRLSTVIFLLFTATNVKAQDPNYIEFTRSFFSGLMDREEMRDTFIYDNVDTNTISELKTFINTGVLKNYYGKRMHVKDSLVLTSAEVKYINDQLSDKDNDWVSKVLINAVKYNPYKPHTGRTIYYFSKPILLRNETFCLFYYEYVCGRLCGKTNFGLYKKENNKWTLYITLVDSIS